MNIPSGYQTVMPYLMVKNAGKFIELVQLVEDHPYGRIAKRGL